MREPLPESRKNTLLMALGVVVLTLIAYIPAFNAGYVMDDEAVWENPLLRSTTGLLAIWFDPAQNTYEEHYWPLTYTIFWLERALFGDNPSAFHAINILFHAANSVWVGLILSRLRIPGAWVAAVLFGVHPMHVESVAWIIEGKDVFSGFFALIAVFLAISPNNVNSEPNKPRNYARYAIIPFVMALLCKGAVIGIPLVILCLWLWKALHNPKAFAAPWLTPLFAASIAFALIDLAYVRAHRSHFETEIIEHSMLDRWAVPLRSLYFYMGKTLLPFHHTPLYPRWDFSLAPFVAYVFTTIFMITMMLVCATSRIKALFVLSFLCYTFLLLPTLGMVSFSYMRHSYVADRFSYLALTVPLAGVVSAVAFISGRFAPSKPFVSALVVIAIGLLTAQTAKLSATYRTPDTYYQHILNVNPQSDVALYNWGNAKAAQGDQEGAIECYEMAIELKPNDPSMWTNVGNSYARMSRYLDAETAFRNALALDPDRPTAGYGLALTLARSGRPDEALALLRKIAERSPQHESSRRLLAELERKGSHPR